MPFYLWNYEGFQDKLQKHHENPSASADTATSNNYMECMVSEVMLSWLHRFSR